MDPNANNRPMTRGQTPTEPANAQGATRGQIPASVAYFPFVIPVYQQTSVSQWEFTPGPYDRRGYYIPPAAGAPPADTAGKGKHTAQISIGQPIPSSTTHLIARQNISGGSTTPYKNITTNHPHDDFRLLGIEMKSPYAVLYLSIGGPPLTFKSDGLEQHPNRIARVRLSAGWLSPSQRSVIWADPKKRQQELISLFEPKEPMTPEQAAKVPLNNIRLPLPLALTQAEFWKIVLSLFPSNVGGVYRVLEWAIACPTCGQEVVGQASDALWSMRYTDHRKSLCGKISNVKH